MALSGSFSTTEGTNLTLIAEWSATQNLRTNQSTITANLYLQYWDIYVGARAARISIGDGYKDITVPTINDTGNSGLTKKLIGSYSRTVSHNANGGLSLTLSGSWSPQITYNGEYIGTISASKTVALDSLDRSAPTITASVNTITSSSVKIAGSANATCDSWQYSLNNGAAWSTLSAPGGAVVGGLKPNTAYSIKVRARKVSNYVTGTSGTVSVKTLGFTVLNSVSDFAVDDTASSLTLNTTVYDSRWNYKLEVSGGSGIITTITVPSMTTGTKNVAVAVTAAQKTAILGSMAKLRSFSATFTLKTYDGSALVGSSAKSGTILTDASRSAPIFPASMTFSLYDSNAAVTQVTETNTVLVKDLSQLKVRSSIATARNGASIVKYEIKAGSGTISLGAVNSIDHVFGAISSTGTATVTITAFDSRGYTVSKSGAITVIPYTPITLGNLTVRRRNETDAKTQILLEGSFSPINVNGEQKNGFVRAYYQYKPTSSDTYGSQTEMEAVTVTGTRFQFETTDLTDILLQENNSYDVRVVVQDKLGSYQTAAVVPQGQPLIAFRTKKVGVNQPNPTAALDIVGGLKASGNANIGGSITTGAATVKGTIDASGAVSAANIKSTAGFQNIQNGVTLTIASDNTYYTHIRSTKPFYFNQNLNVDGSILDYKAGGIQLIAYGTTSHGGYLKFSNGTLVCHGFVAEYAAWKDGGQAQYISVSYPQAYKTAPSIVATGQNDSGSDGTAWVNDPSPGLTSFNLRRYSTNPNVTKTIGAYWLSIGRWK